MSAWSNSTEVRIDGIGKVVQELRALIEEGGVVLVAFEDEMLALPQLKAAAEIFRNAANQERRLRPRQLWKIHASIDVVVVLPCVPATTSDFFAAQKFLVQDRGSEQNGMRWSSTYSNSTLPREIALPTTTSRAAARDCCRIGLGNRNVQRGQQVPHGRIRRGVGAGNAMPALLAAFRPAMPWPCRRYQ